MTQDRNGDADWRLEVAATQTKPGQAGLVAGHTGGRLRRFYATPEVAATQTKPGLAGLVAGHTGGRLEVAAGASHIWGAAVNECLRQSE